MEYSRREVNQDRERDIVIGLIVSDQFTKEVLPLLKPEYFALPYSRTVAKWCIDFYNNYSKAPDKEIMSVFESKKIEIRDQSVIETIEIFLTKLSDRFEAQESFNVGYNVDRALNYFKERSIDLMIERIKVAKLSGDLNRAEAEVSNFKRVEKGRGTATSVWNDIDEAMKSIRVDDKDVIVKFPGALGQVIRPLTSEDFIAFIAPAKRGKSYWLVELAILCSLNRKNVLFITLEMPSHQLRTRIFQRVTGEVVSKYDEYSDTREVEVPYFDANFEITNKIHKRKEMRNQISPRSVSRKMSSIMMLTKSDNFRIISAPANSYNGNDLEADLDNLKHYNEFVPDVVILDYADIMAAKKNNEHRHTIDEKWESLRSIGQKRNVLMATVSHTSKGSIQRDVRADDIVEDQRKLNHVTLCIGINQLQEDKEQGVQRLAVLIDRHADFNPAKQAVVTQCLQVGGVYLDSRIKYRGVKVEE